MSKSLGLIDGGGRLTAWELILQNEITTLPVNPFVLAEKSKINALTYSQLAENTGNDVSFYEKEYNDTAFAYKLDEQYYIAYKTAPNMDMNQLRVDVMHELCHIFLDHPVQGDDMNPTPEQARAAELEANKLTRRILAPSIVLHMCGCSSAKEIAKLCGLPMKWANQRYDHLQDLRHRNALMIAEVERKTLRQFADFVCSYLVEKHK